MAERFTNVPFCLEGQYREMFNFETLYAVTYGCPDPAIFASLNGHELNAMGEIIDNIGFS